MSIPAFSAASSIVVPSVTDTGFWSIVSFIMISFFDKNWMKNTLAMDEIIVLVLLLFYSTSMASYLHFEKQMPHFIHLSWSIL